MGEQIDAGVSQFTFRSASEPAKRREKLSGRYLEAFDAALVWARIGTTSAGDTIDSLWGMSKEPLETASESQK